tara:strand:- start:111823 stop:115026 length:3204 start_codon:yes stop_codon:yes gene_type:complete
MSELKKRYSIFIIVFCLQFLVQETYAQFYNGSEQQFGKNRVQYQEFYWQYYRYPKFNSYFYKGGENLAKTVAERVQNYLPLYENQFEITLENKLQVIVYKSFSDFKQSNIGYEANTDYNIGGTTQLIGNNLFVYYPGTMKALDEQIKLGLTQVFVDMSLYGSSLQDNVRSSALMSLPTWFTKGIVAYYSKGFSTEVDLKVKDAFLNGELENFNRLEGVMTEYAGLSMWNFIAEKYGEKVFANILAMTSVTRNVEEGILYVLGFSLDGLFLEYKNFYTAKYNSDAWSTAVSKYQKQDIKVKEARVYTQAKLSPNAKHLAYVSNELGQYRVFVYNIEDDSRNKIIKADHKLLRNTDKSFPVLAWHPKSKILAFTQEKKGRLFLVTYNLSKDELDETEIFALDKISSMAYEPDGKTLILSASRDGKSDLYRYFITGNRQTNLTNDTWDDMNPSVKENGEILFTSNAPSASATSSDVFQNTYDVFKLDAKRKRVRLTDTPKENEILAQPYDGESFTYLSDKYGAYNRFVGRKDSSILSVDTIIRYNYFTDSYPVSNIDRHVEDYSISPKTGEYSLLIYANGRYGFYIGNTAADEAVEFSETSVGNVKSIKSFNFNTLDTSTVVNDNYKSVAKKANGNALKFKSEKKRGIDIENYVFTDDEAKIKQSENNKPEELGIERRNYNINFTAKDFSAQIDNNYINGFYQLLLGPQTVSPGLGVFSKVGVSDLFEDYRITGGIRFSANLENNDYLLRYDNLRKRLDKSFVLTRVNSRFTNGLNVFGSQTYTANYVNHYAISEVTSVELVPLLKYDRVVPLATDVFSLEAEPFEEYTYGLRANYVFDNTLPISTNLRQGLRVKFFAEYYRGSELKGELITLGFDARHYTKIHRSIIWANRLAFSATGGRSKVLFYAGGVDRWLYLPEAEDNSKSPDLTDYLYQGTVTPLRGHNRNIRNGNQFVLLNSELRFPIVKYFSKKPLKSRFLESLQAVAFTDIGTAWTGINPYDRENAFNVDVIEGNPVTVSLQTRENPFVGGYGFGLRAYLLGYFVKADWAYPINPIGESQRLFYLSLALDF